MDFNSSDLAFSTTINVYVHIVHILNDKVAYFGYKIFGTDWQTDYMYKL